VTVPKFDEQDNPSKVKEIVFQIIGRRTLTNHNYRDIEFKWRLKNSNLVNGEFQEGADPVDRGGDI